MATDIEFIEYVCEQIKETGRIRYRKMFGEYMVYINDKPIFLVCDNTVYIKKHECLAEVLKDAELGCPYSGAKEHYVLDIDNQEICGKVVRLVEPILTVPKVKTSKER